MLKRISENSISIADLEAFCEAAYYKSFSQAATMMGVSPAYMTKRIQSLEDSLDAKLFHRSTRYIALTEQGENIREMALEIIDNIDRLRDKVVATKNQLRGELRVATSFGFGRRVVSDALAQFSLKYPAINIKLEVLDRLVDMVRDRYDLDVRIGDIIDPNYIARKLATNYRIMCASPEYLEKYGEPQNPIDLSKHNCLIVRERDHPVGIWRLNKEDYVENVKVSGSLTTNNGEIAVAWALNGHGIMLRSVWDSQRHLQSGQLVHILKDYRQDANIWVVYPERLGASAKVKACADHLEEYFSDWHKKSAALAGVKI